MGFPTALAASTRPRVYVARIPEGRSLPDAHIFASTGAASAGATSLTLDWVSTNGSANSSGTIELEHDQPILFPANSTINVDGTSFAAGDYSLEVDDGLGAVPTDLIAVGDYFKLAGDSTLYRVTNRSAGVNGYKIRVYPELQSAPADDAAVTVYNLVRLNLGTGVQFVDIDTTGVSVNVTGVTYAMDAAANSLDTYKFRQVIGVESSSPTTSVETTDVATNTLTTTLKGTVGFEVAVEGIAIPGDSANTEIIQPFLLDSGRSSESIYTRYESSSDAKVYQGPGSLTEADAGESINEADTYSVTLSISVANRTDGFEYWLR